VEPGRMSAAAQIASIASDFGDAFDFIFKGTESRSGGSDVGGTQLLGLFWEHLKLSATAMALAVAVAVPLGTWLGHTKRGTFLAVGVANVGRAVPSIALIALFFAFLGTGFLNIALALTLLAIPPILANTYVGVRSVEPDAVDAARGVGMTGLEIVRQVELPLASTLVFGGIRTSAVNVVATATIAPLAGVSSLGDPIIAYGVYGDAGRLGGSIVVAALAVATELTFGGVQRLVDPLPHKRRYLPA